MKTIFTSFIFVALACFSSSLAIAQDECLTWRLESTTVYDKKPVTVTKYVDETVMEKEKRTSWKPVWQTEKRERRTTVLKPVQKTRQVEERYTVMRPVTETKYRERRIEETSYEEVTEMREERRVVQKPVIETQMRDEEFTVRRKIIEQQMRTENVTQYKPVTSSGIQLVPGTAVAAVGTVNETFRPQLKWLQPGQYNDPTTGANTWRRRGLHWVQPPPITGVQTAVVPTLTPQTVQTTTLVPEVVQRSSPVEVIRYEDRVERRKVPVEVRKMVEQIEIRKIPVTTRRPKTVTRVEKIPYQETEYREQEMIRRVPVTETTYERVEQVEPFEERTCKWVAYTEEIEVPKTVRKKVEYTTYQQVPRTVTRRVAFDQFGRRVKVVPVPQPKPALSSAFSSTQTVNDRIVQTVRDAEPAAKTRTETSDRRPSNDTGIVSDGQSGQRIDYLGRPNVQREASFYQPNEPTSVLVPETRPELSRPRTKLSRVEKTSSFGYDPENAAMTARNATGEPEPKPETHQVETRETSARTFDWDVPAASLPETSN